MQVVEKKPLYSIIIVCLNAESIIAETIYSVLAQTEGNYEIIIKDGISKDRTIECIPSDPRIRIYREKDSGIYNAMNQAVTHINGEWVCFLNCGDKFADNKVLGMVTKHIKKNNIAPKMCIIYGDYIRKNEYIKQSSKINDFTLFRTPITHQTMFFSSDIFAEKMFDETFIIRADHELTIASYKKGVKFKYINSAISNYQGDGFSERKELKKTRKEEFRRIIKKHFNTKQRIIYSTFIFLSMRKFRGYLNSDNSPKIIRKVYRKFSNKVNR